MDMMNYFVEKINENSTVKVSVHFYPEKFKIQITAEWDCGFTGKENFNSIAESTAYLRGFYDAIPF